MPSLYTKVRTFNVTAMAVNTASNTIEAPARTERVDTSNPIFAGATGPWDIEDRYHAFWNRLNESDQFAQRAIKVVVISVVEV